MAVPSLNAVIANKLAGFGGILRCGTCGAQRAVEGVGGFLARGWPTCCKGHAMTWWTQRQIAAGEMPDQVQ